jgi:thiol-disulfide isomerase/thioredoxin
VGLLVGAAWLTRDHFEPVVAGHQAPEFLVTTLDGQSVGLDRYQGKVVLLNVWATWCAPCLEEMPSMERLYQQLTGTDFEILAVSVDLPVDGGVPVRTLESFARELDLSFPILYSPPGGPRSIQEIFQTAGVPESFLIGKDGVIYRRLAGPTVWDAPQYREQIIRLLGD